MRLIVSNHAHVPAIQKFQNVTKILSVIEPDFPQPYQQFHPAQIYRIGMSDHETAGEYYMAPSHKHLRDIIEFSDRCTDEDVVLINCYAGKSRSTATALAIIYHKTMNIELSKETLLKVRPQAAPNTLLCSIIDESFGLDNVFYNFAKELNIKNNKNFDNT